MIIFCVGLELYNAGISEKHYIYYMLVYSMMSPIGIAIGITVDVGLEHHHEEAYKSIVGLLQVSMIFFFVEYIVIKFPLNFHFQSSTVTGFFDSGTCWRKPIVLSRIRNTSEREVQRKSARNVAIVVRHYRIPSYNVSGHYRLWKNYDISL